jgi:hypothetical protein
MSHPLGHFCCAAKATVHSPPSAHIAHPGVACQNSPIGGSPSANHMTSKIASAVRSICTLYSHTP